MKYVLRKYQEECIATVLSKFNEISSQLIQLPTGAGKTVILWHIIQALGLRALIVAPTRELIEQIEETGGNIVGSESIFCKKKSFIPDLDGINNFVMTSQAATWLLKQDKIGVFDPEIVIIDEAHRSRSENLENLLNYFKDKGVKLLGLTATPERLDGKSLLKVYDELTYSITLVELINQGYLVDLECYRIKTQHKLQDMTCRNGDFSASVLSQLDLQGRNQIILDVFKKKCTDKKTLIFCLSISHAVKMAQLFKDEGVTSEAIYGALCKETRKKMITKFRNGEIQVLCNCQLLTEGFDEPSIESLIIARPTRSKTLYCQMVGRGVRPYKNKELCLVFDISDNIHNICTFNVLADIENTNGRSWKCGDKLSDVHKKYELTLNDINFKIEAFDLYEKAKNHPALLHQKQFLKIREIPYFDDTTMIQAAYLIFKHNMMRTHGINTKNYWKKWRLIQSPNPL